MLTAETISIIKATAPVLAEHGETITANFYKRMFVNNPEVRPYFNMSNQAVGSQPKALAGSIIAFASNVEHLDRLEKIVSLIAHKHASLMVQPEQYPIIGKNLLEAIADVLGEAATPEILKAWGEAYFFLADILIQAEKDLYLAQTEDTSGWRGFKDFEITDIQPESAEIKSFYLQPVSGDKLPSFLPGQYITLRVPDSEGSTTMRNYSLSDVPGKATYRISVKREASRADKPGYVSNLLHDEFAIGDKIEVGPPCGDFVYDIEKANGDKPVVLIAGGIGITPLLPMLSIILTQQPEREVEFIQATRNKTVQPFRDLLDELASEHEQLSVKYLYSEEQGSPLQHTEYVGLPDVKTMEKLIPSKQSEFFYCGPPAFLDIMAQCMSAWNIPQNQQHYEYFGPHQNLAGEADQSEEAMA